MSKIILVRAVRQLWQGRRVAGVLLLTLAVLTTSVCIKVVAAPAPEIDPKKKDEPKKDEPKKDEPKKDEPKKEPAVEQPGNPNAPGFPPGVDPALIKKMQETNRKMIEQMQQQMQRMR